MAKNTSTNKEFPDLSMITSALIDKTEILTYTKAKNILLTEAVRLKEFGLNHDSCIVEDAAKLIDAKINELQCVFDSKYKC